MLDSRVIEQIRQILDGPPRRVLVTGGTGFVGSHVASLLAEAGQQVTAIARNRYRIGRGFHSDVSFVECDIEDQQTISRLCENHEVVIHAAALAATWGDTATFRRINVDGTQHIVNALRSLPAKRLIHISSTAIHFEFRNKVDVQENATLPPVFACEYAASKAASENVVLDAVQDGLNAVIIRARAVFGSGDNSLLPRLLNAAKRGRLPQIGNGKNVVDLTYVDNLAYAICLAINRGEPGTICTITNEEPVALWPTLNRMFESLGMPTTRRQLAYKPALMLASAACGWHALTGREGEPTLTRYGVGLLANSQTFSPDAARQALGYRPIVSLEQGIQRTLDSLSAKDDQHAGVSCELELFTTGYTPQPYHLAERGQTKDVQKFHALVGLIRHPRYGLYLFDTGYAPRFRDATRKLPYRIYGYVSPVVIGESLTIRSQLEAKGIAAKDIRGIITSHFHADHVAGHLDFPQAQFIASQRAWHDVRKRTGIGALRRGYLPSLMPAPCTRQIRTIDQFHDPGMGPFSRSHDLFGDGSVRLFDLPGHALGQIGALIQTSPERRVFLAADATWTLGALRRGVLPHPMTYSFIDSVADLRNTLNQLQAFQRLYPNIEIVPTHCPGVAMKYSFNAIVAQHIAADSQDKSKSE
jgi:2-alkyl-3-oxoalkanoate reductase